MNSELLIQTLIEDVRLALDRAEKFKSHDISTLTWRESKNSWNVLECLAHLNLYGDFYLPQIESKIRTSATRSDREFISGLLGGYLAKSMLPKGELNRIGTFKEMNPLNRELDEVVIDKFIDQQIKLLTLLNSSRNVSLNKIKIQTSISTLLRLKLGDTFQFLVNHTVRHLDQIDRVMVSLKNV